jgi:hypothetical protein
MASRASSEFPDLVSGKGLALEEDDFVTGTSHERAGATGAATNNENIAFVRRQVHLNSSQLRLCGRLDLQRVKIDSFDLVERAVGPHFFENAVKGLA